LEARDAIPMTDTDKSDLAETSASESEFSSPERSDLHNHQHHGPTLLHRRHLSTSRITTQTQTTVMDPQGNIISTTTTTTKKTTVGPASKHSKGPKKSQFRARTSKLDYETLLREDNPMRGFFVLFWMAMAWYCVTTMYHTLRTEGFPFRLNFMWHILKDGDGLAMSDFVLVTSCGMVVIFQTLFKWGWVPLKYSTIIQHTWQGIWFMSIVCWCFIRDWPWVRVFFFLHYTCLLEV
jgi:hypothetical protein